MSDMQWRFLVLLPLCLAAIGVGGLIGWGIAALQLRQMNRLEGDK